MAEEKFNKEKFAELVLYIAKRTLSDEDFGATKMAKALWKADFVAFARLGRSITGAEYQKLDFGPAAREFRPVLSDLKMGKAAEEALQSFGGYTLRKVVAIRDANVDVFTVREIEIIESALEWVRSRTAKQVSRESHGWAWELAEMYETIPYGTELIPAEPLALPEEAIRYGEQLAARLGED